MELLNQCTHLPNTKRFLQDKLDDRLQRTINESESWKVELPIWCIVKQLRTPKDELFQMQVSDLHKHVCLLYRKFPNANEDFATALDALVSLQERQTVFKDVDEIIHSAALLHFKSTSSYLLQNIDSQSWQDLLSNIEYLWLKDMILLVAENTTASLTSGLWGDKDVPLPEPESNKVAEAMRILETSRNNLQSFLRADIRYIALLLHDDLQEAADFHALIRFLAEFESCHLSVDEWKEIMADRPTGPTLLHEQLIAHVMRKIPALDNLRKNTIVALEKAVVGVFMECDWNLSDMKPFLERIHSDSDAESVYRSLQVVHEYRWDGKPEELLASLPPDLTSWHNHTSEYITKKIVKSEVHEYSVDELIKELVKNADDERVTEQLLHDLYKDYRGGISENSEKSTGELSGMLKSAGYVKRASIVILVLNNFNGYSLRTVQELTVLLAVDARSKGSSRLLQVPTGEGKTNIVAAVAAIEASDGKTVDIITSSSELAVNQHAAMKPFFDSLGISSSHNAGGNASNMKAGDGSKEAMMNFLEGNTDALKEVYESTVVYGPVTDFLADVLHDEFAGRGLRHERKNEMAIVDEVDSMFLDGRSDSVRLSSRTPGMADLLPVYATVWAQVKIVHGLMLQRDGLWYYTGDGDECEVTNLDMFIETAVLPYMQKVLRFIPLTEEDLGGISTGSEEGKGPTMIEFPQLIVPKHLKKHVKLTLGKLVQSAINALFHMKPGFDYVVEETSVVVVDAANTGVHHPTMRWSHGLHQFLQMKHSLPVESESVATNFISNVTFFLRYGQNVIGLTGTIGGPDSREFLKKAYDVTFVDVPSFRERRYFEMTPSLCVNEEEWMDEITTSAASKLHSGRAVLIITQFIASALKVKERIEKIASNTFLYTDSRTGAETLGRKLMAGDCVVATNIAGRGTDLHVSNEVEAEGGMHVLLTFLPENDRVERQAVGRTARTGQRGSSQLIIDVSKLRMEIALQIMDSRQKTEKSRFECVSRMKWKRAELCLDQARSALEEVDKCKAQDEIFREYMNIREKKLKDSATKPEKLKDALDNIFGMWLRTHEDDMNIENLRGFFEKAPLNNPYDLVRLGDIEEALKKDKDGFCISAIYSDACTHVTKYDKSSTTEELTSSIEKFQKAREKLEEKKRRLDLMIRVAGIPTKVDREEKKEDKEEITNEDSEEGEKKEKVDNGPAIEEEKTQLYRQIERHSTVLGVITANIDSLIGRDIEKEIEMLEKSMNDPSAQEDEKEGMRKRMEELKESGEEDRIGILGVIKNKGAEINMSFVPLKEALNRTEYQENFEKELEFYADEQLCSLLEVNEKQPINWWNFVGLAGLAILQMIGGAAAAVFSLGAGASIGLSMLQEGVSDMITAVKDGLIDRCFDWAEWAINKGISLAVTLCAYGISAIKSAVKGITTGVKNASAIVKGSATRVTKEGFKLAGKAIGQAVTKEVASLAVSQVVDYCAPGVDSTPLPVIVNKALEAVLKNDPNLQLLLKYDEKKKKPFFSEKLRKGFMEELATNISVIDKLVSTARKITKALAERTGRMELKVLGTTLKAFDWMTVPVVQLQFVKKVVDNLVDSNQDKLKELNESDEKKSEELKKDTDEIDALFHKTNEKVPTGKPLSVEKFLERVSRDIASYIVKRTGIKDIIVSKTVDLAASHTFTVTEDMKQYRKSFVQTEVVLQEIEKKKTSAETDDERRRVEYVEGIATTTAGGLREAETLAAVVRQPIFIRVKNGENGDEKIIRFGSGHPGEPIEIIYTRGTDENGNISHFVPHSSSSGSDFSQKTCLFEAVEAQTKYEAGLLRRATASRMLEQGDSDDNNNPFMSTFGDRPSSTSQQSLSSETPSTPSSNEP